MATFPGDDVLVFSDDLQRAIEDVLASQQQTMTLNTNNSDSAHFERFFLVTFQCFVQSYRLKIRTITTARYRGVYATYVRIG
jgi:hypothetical protein